VFSSPAHADYVPVLNWLNRPGGGWLTTGGKNRSEISNMVRAVEFINILAIAGKVQFVDEGDIDRAAATIRPGTLRSNDSHVIALAIVSGTRLLCTGETTGHLANDFATYKFPNRRRGKVYQRVEQAQTLLRHVRRQCSGKPR
jgi:predicted nucleic acid-binding protein